ncbi:hypothetical protein MPER_00613, partial [Moniliophthora perniciosa FA553]
RIERTKKYLTHDPEDKLRKDDVVIIRNCPPISARKRFKLEKIVKSPETERALLRAQRAAEVAGHPPTLEESAAVSADETQRVQL